MNDTLVRFYKAFHTAERGAQAALLLARKRIAAGDTSPARALSGPPKASAGGQPYSALRYVENFQHLGLRMVAFADEIDRSIKHTGWYCNVDEEGGTFRGAVFQVPARRGQARLLAGYVDSESPDRAVVRSQLDAAVATYDADTLRHYCRAAREAARAADALAERDAEQAREYDGAWQAGVRYAGNRDEIRRLRKEARAFAFAARDNVTHNEVICQALRERVQGCRSQVHDLIEDCKRMANGDGTRHGWYLAFWTGSPKLRAAFNEGAGETVLA